MRRPRNRFIGYFYYFTSFILCALGLLCYPPFVSWVVSISATIFVIYAILTATLPTTTINENKVKAWLTLWGLQGITYLLWIVFGILWFAHFPEYGNLQPFFASHLSFSLLFSAFVLANEINAISYLMQRWKKPASVLLFFPNQKMDLRIAIYGNIWWRRATVIISFIFLLFSASSLISPFHGNILILFFTIALAIFFIKSPLFYQWLQIILKRWKVNFAHLLLLIIACVLLICVFLHWLLQPIFPATNFHLSAHFTDTPLIIFWGFAICLTVPLAFLLPAKLTALAPRAILGLTLSNPLLWLLLILDAQKKLQPFLQNIPHSLSLTISVTMIVASYIWLVSPTFGALNKNFFINNAEQHQGPIPRILVQNNLPIALLIIFALSIQLPTFFQVDLMATGAYVLIAYGVSTGILLFKLRRL